MPSKSFEQCTPDRCAAGRGTAFRVELGRRSGQPRDGKSAGGIFQRLQSSCPRGIEAFPDRWSWLAFSGRSGDTPRAFRSETLRSHLFRLRSRYRALLRAEVLRTVAHEKDVDEELRYLCRVLIARA